jgi:acyl dehydratase
MTETATATGTADPTTAEVPLIRAGETFARGMRYGARQIIDFARLSGDTNPLHLDDGAARQAGYDGIIASGQQSAAQMMGLVASHFSRDDDGHARDMLCLNFNFAFKAPIHADTDVELRWTVASVEFNPRLDGWIGQLNGSARCDGGIDCVIARGTVLVKHLAAA